jgi:transposase
VRQGVVPLRKALPDILSSNTNILSPRMVSLIADLMQDWRRLDERIETVSTEIEALALQDDIAGPASFAPVRSSTCKVA